MEDDIRRRGEIPAGFGPAFASEIDGILQHSGPRENALLWAKNLRFLTFDDGTDVSTTRKTPVSKSGQCQRCAQGVPLPSGHKCAIHANIRLTPKELETWERKLQSYSNPCVHVEDLTCDGCRHIPLFPNTGDISTFRIRRAKVECVDGIAVNCKHFVAVSYCWSSQEDDESEDKDKAQPYTVIEENGTRRPVRASRATIDRVVRFARENGFRMIWIDQECIEQDNPTEKELSIQSMDLVYQKAHTCIGLMSIKWEQRHLNAFLLDAELSAKGKQENNRRGPRPVRKGPPLPPEEFMEDLVEAVYGLVYDRWNTRAWVLQEAFIASDRMLLLFPRVEPVDVSGWWFVCHEKSLTELAVSLHMIQDALEYYVLPHFPRDIMTAEKGSWQAKFFDDIRFFYPRSIDTLFRLSLGDFWERKGCDAATALAFLKRRDLFRVADRIAILANICGYEKRLNTTELEKSGRNLSHCLLSLAIINGDLSLLLPEMYNVPSSHSIGKSEKLDNIL
ncbi:uncharacterized protein CTRU02_205034 [Colletotrichum truncatum]|uniref:Uncharacterized protein n=1 Tax=Colletotrichum truncatum TaxID=5467 RepID=A0ACC3Z2X6_COLTU